MEMPSADQEGVKIHQVGTKGLTWLRTRTVFGNKEWC